MATLATRAVTSGHWAWCLRNGHGHEAVSGEDCLRAELGDPPQPPPPLPPSAPEGLRSVIMRSLEREPGAATGRRRGHCGARDGGTGKRRFDAATARHGRGARGRLSEVSLVLAAAVIVLLWPAGRALLRGRAPRPIRSVAVLPLENLSHDSTQDFFADGMTEALIINLAKIGALRVPSRTSVMHYRASTKTIPEIARELGVDALVAGSAQLEGQRVRVTAQLIQADRDQHLWADSYERDLRDILAMQTVRATSAGRYGRI